MDMLPPQAPPAIISSVNQPERDALQRLAETQAWLYAQQDELPDPYVASDETENLFLLDIDAFWRTDTVDTPLPGQTGMSRRQALGAHLARAARDNATLLAGHGLLSPTAIDIVRRATGPDRTKLPTLHLSELLIGQTPQAGTLILQDDHAPDTVLLFGTRTGWESFQSLDELLCEVEERLQLQLFHADDELAIDEVDAHFLRALPLEGPPFDTIADRIIAAYRDSVARMWTGDILSSDWEDRLNEAMQLASIFDLHRLGALPGNVYPISPTTSSSLLKRGRRAAPTGASLGAASGAARRTGTARGVAEHLGPVPGTAQRMAGSVARHLGVGVPRSPTMTPPTSTLPRPQDMFSRRYSAPEVMLPAGPTPADSVYRLDGSSYVQHNGLPYRVQYDPVGNAWRLSSRGPTHGVNTGPIIDLGPDGRWEIQFPAPHAATAPIPVQRTPVESPVHHMSESNTGGSHTVPAWPSVDVLPATPVASGTSTPMQPIDLPSGSLSGLPKILKDIMREELTRQLDNSVVGALTLFRRVRRWHDGVDATIHLGSDDIDAWNAAMRNMRDRMDQVVNVPSPGMPAASHVTDTLPGPETSDDLLARARTGDLSDTGEATLSELLVTHPTTVPVENLTPETLDAWSNAANEFVAQPRLVSSPAPHSSASPAVTANGATAPILNKTLPIYPFDRPRLNDRALMLEEMGRLMPSQAAAEALLKRMQDAYLADGSVPRLSRMEENAWRGAIAHLDLPQPSKYRARRMDAAELPHRSLESARSRQNYFVTAGKTATPFDRLMYLRDKQGELIHLTTAEQDEWRSLLDFIRSKRGSTADVGLPSKRYRPELGDLAIADIRTIQRRLEKRFGKEAQEEIFKHNALSGPISRPLTDAEERAWREALTEVRERPSHFESDIPSEAIRDFSTDDMRELWRELRSRTGSRRAQTIYRTHALRQLPDSQPPLSTVVAPQWQPAVDAVRLRRRAPPPASMTLEEVSRALWHVPQEAWPTTLYHYVPAATLAEATDHVIRLPITRLESLGADGIPVFTSPPNTATLDLPTRHTALLPDQAPGLVPDASAPTGSIGGRSGTWVQFNPTEVRESLETFVELYRVGGPTSTSFVLRPTQQSVAVGFTELWLNTPFVIHRPLP